MSNNLLAMMNHFDGGAESDLTGHEDTFIRCSASEQVVLGRVIGLWRTINHLKQQVAHLSAEIDRLQGDLEDAKMGYCPMCNVFGGCAHTSEGEE